jgi:hypothetical protein
MRALKRTLVFTLLLAQGGCARTPEAEPPGSDAGRRFTVTYSQDLGFASGVNVIRDSETGREYLFMKVGYGAGLALMPESSR